MFILYLYHNHNFKQSYKDIKFQSDLLLKFAYYIVIL